ncbi:PEP-CTERM sorting domain-containing protein [Roseibacillus persicicus]|uniref:PEP-CTERM sorting domain-containing protein n=1 Tax=Roseibacillus persicicus TaxID=454148 RepID=UPI00280C8F21|nr:PEP-CTERM sorting domain-containing protein [Roseibacillus persicicus]MDQ8190335.1 PEP-CTERM sorting domain-containing protein [Roseibacillus persicicus]
MKLNAAAWMVALVVGSGSLVSGAVVTTSDQLEFVVGAGANLSVLVFDFNDGSSQSSFAWGYRWDGSASGEDMLAAVAGADANLTLDSSSFVGNVSYFDGSTLHSAASDFGAGAVSWGYYLAGGFAGDDSMNNGNVDTPASILGGGVTYPTTFTISPTGASANSFGDSGRLLADGSWDVWSFGPYNPGTYAHEEPPGSEAPAAASVPEPASTGLFASFLLCWSLRRKR